MKKKVVIIGAGPAGLTAGYELLRRSDEYEIVILEESDRFGGISRTVNYKGNRMDMGGHRFFSKVPEVNKWWSEMMPLQGAPAKDELILGTCHENGDGPDPEKTDVVMLQRNRVSRILFNQKFFDYPITLKKQTFANMGFKNTVEAGFSYLKACVHKRPENSLEDFYINRFGKKLYSMFFEHYTENLWGRHPSQIDPSWGAQRVKGLSIKAVLKNAIEKNSGKKDRKVETSLIESFYYPKLGPGEMWDLTAEKIEKLGGKIIKKAEVDEIHRNENGTVDYIGYVRNGNREHIVCDYLISSMPLKDLVAGMNDVPEEPACVAAGLPYRDYKTVGVLVRHLNLENTTDIRTVGNIVPDDWVYVHDRTVKMGRFQIYNNWSPYMVNDLEHTVWIGLEYFCNEGDDLWTMDDSDFSAMGIREMQTLHMIDGPQDVIDTHVERVKKAYPAYFDTYEEFGTLQAFLDSIPNLFCVGRNGQHRYNNMDHSMCTSFEAVKDILNGNADHSNVWSVNTEQEYHEEKKD